MTGPISSISCLIYNHAVNELARYANRREDFSRFFSSYVTLLSMANNATIMCSYRFLQGEIAHENRG